MAYTYQGDAILGVSLTVETPKPLDTRTVVNATKDLYEVPASQAYRGMTISNLEDGNIYMLIDKNKMTIADGWKSSQSALQIITCTQEEYNKWAANTDENYNPIDKNENYILQSVYYYTYEEDQGQYYLSSEWGKNIEDQLSKKASADALTNVLKQTNELAENLANNYTITSDIIATYATIELINSMFNMGSEDSFIKQTLSDYYTSQEVDDKFVTKDSLGGNIDDLGGTDYVFVTSSQYAEDQKAIQEELAKTLKLDGEGSLESITVGQIKSPIEEGVEQLVVDVKSDGLYIGEDPIATESDIPVFIDIALKDYEALVEAGKHNPETYYCIYDEEDNKLVYVTLRDLEASYSTTTQTQYWVAQNFYTMPQIDAKLENLKQERDQILSDELSKYYTSENTDAKFLTQEDAANTYATQTNLEDFQKTVASDYVTWKAIGNPEIEGEDFAFVTQEQYATDKTEQALKIETKELSSSTTITSELIIQKIEEKEVEQEEDTKGETTTVIEQIVTSEINLTSEDNRLMSGGKQVALTEEVPRLVYITTKAYQDLLDSGNIDSDVYYCTYEEGDDPSNGYVTYAYVTETFQTKSQASQDLHNTKLELERKIQNLETELQNLKNMFFSQVSGNTLTLGLLDNIDNNVLVANTGKVENKTLIFT